MKENLYTIINKGYKEFSELDFQLYDELFGKDDLTTNKSIGDNQRVDGHPILIDNLIDELQELKDKGANYIAIEAYNDNHGYNIEAYDIHISTENEIKIHLEEIEKNIKRKKQKEYNILFKKLEELKKEL